MPLLIPAGLTAGQYVTCVREGGIVLRAGPDPVTKGAPWTGGVGCTGTMMTRPGETITEGYTLTAEQWGAEYLARYRRDEAQAAVDLGAAYWDDLDPVRRAVLADIAHQDGGGNAARGVGGLAGFRHMLAAIRAQNWKLAQLECQDSNPTTPARRDENAKMLLTGSWPLWVPTSYQK